MVICPQCNIEHEPGEEFCKKCGKFLLTVEEPSVDGEMTDLKLICPKCKLVYKKGNYCRKCGSLLMKGIPSQIMAVHPLEKKSVKRQSREWLKLLRKEKELESCMSNLEEQRERVSSDILRPIFNRYKDQLESLSPLHQEIETELESIRKNAFEEIDFLEKELNPIQKSLEEFQSLYKSGAVTKPDFLREKKELRREIKSKERDLKKYRNILSLLPNKMGGAFVSSGVPGNLLRPSILLTAGFVILLIIGGGYLLWQKKSPSIEPTSKVIVTSPTSTSSLQRPSSATEYQEVEKIKSLLENIKQANLKKNIDLFMSCYSRDFTDREIKRLNTLETWGFYDYHALSYDLKKQTIAGDTANVRLEWLIQISKKAGGQPEDKRTLMDVTLKREDGHWKIKEIKPAS
jgi:hypothetical protein